MAWVPFASFGVASDATVYTYSVARQIQRLDPASGAVLNRSMPIPFDSAAFTPRIAIDSVGRVFLTNGGVSDGALYSFNADLTLRWSDGVRGVTLGGTALHHDGTLLVCGFDGVRAYRNSSSQGTVVGSTSNGIADIRETPDISSGAATVPGGVRPKGPPQHQMPLGAGHAPLLTVQGGAEMADPLVSPSSDCH
jgi:outer membrane protein assembly factor BamB